MSREKPEIGSMVWIDLTVPEADGVRDFYARVVGWQPVEVDMGGYSDYSMNAPESGTTITGVCHARGVNEAMPPAWMPYFVVADLDESVASCTELGGEVVVAPRELGEGRFCVVRDPAGAVAALYQTKS
ncbi:MAG: VOC family protein [Thermoanaerobaculales bacterium]|jgi:predicted enzyme related to lactoylglutathione lyase|nr:VOC family protein [Thermoanaerobaculales bacterium]